MARSTYLRIYLQDMAALAKGAVRLAQRVLDSNRDGPFSKTLEEVQATLEEDQSAQRAVMDAAGIRPSMTKDIGATFAEAMGRLKLNGELVNYSPLSRVHEFLALLTMLRSRVAFWRSVLILAEGDSRFSSSRAEEALARLTPLIEPLERHHSEAVRLALTS